MLGKPFDYLLLKIASRCNIDCTYCYWFRDETVYQKPKCLQLDAEEALLQKLEDHIVLHRLSDFYILLHGGEPLLFGKQRLRDFCLKIERLAQRVDCPIHLSVTTNGILVDIEWVDLFRRFAIDVTVSLDGPPGVHDRFRIDFKGHGTSHEVERAVRLLMENGITPGVLAVCDPSSDPAVTIDYFVTELGLKKFDVLTPDSTYEDSPDSIADYFIGLFDRWYDVHAKNGVDVRYLRSMMKGLLGGVSKVESIGYGPINTLCMLTDGSLEPLDVIRITGDGATSTDLNIFANSFEDLKQCQVWLDLYTASLSPCTTCLECDYIQACGGGFLPHRFSKDRAYDNPSVYCDDLKKVLSHIWGRIAPEVFVSSHDHSKRKSLETLHPLKN